MKREATLMIAMCLALGGCDRHGPPAAAYIHTRDALLSKLPGGIFGAHACASTEKRGEVEVLISVRTDQCYKMQAPRRYHGVLFTEFEASCFFRGDWNTDRVKALIRQRAKCDYLEWMMNPRDKALLDHRYAQLIAVDFVGRKTAYPVASNVARNYSIVVVDRVNSARLLYQSPEAYIENEWEPH